MANNTDAADQREPYPPQPYPPAAPDDSTTMLDVLASYQKAGYRADFSVAENGHIRCHSCQAITPAAAFDEVSLRRLEGASDPADMLSVVALRCPACSAKGLLLVNYGPEASADQAQVMLALRDRRGRADLPEAQTPDEASTSTD